MQRQRKFWGWGFEDQVLNSAEETFIVSALEARYGVSLPKPVGVPRVEEFSLRAPRVQLPGRLAALVTTDPTERLVHAYGKSFPDALRMFARHVPEPPDAVAYPKTEEDVLALLDWASGEGVAAIPFGGGSSVVGGVEPAVGDSYHGAITIDLARLDKIVEVDRTSRAARIQAGIFGPALERELKPQGLTLRHFPQSFEFSTLGGWIATRSGGHFATLYTHIDDFVESVRMVTPRGVMETRRLPGSGAGPQPDRLVLGSEGIFGIITEAWMRLQSLPTFRGAVSVGFNDFYKAAEAVRALGQSGLYPANCRLIDADEARGTGAGDGSKSLLVLAFESHDHPVEAWMARALELVRDHGGVFDNPKGKASGAHREGAAGAWRDAFLRAPFYRDVLVPRGILSDTFETAVTWDRFPDFHARVTARMLEVIKKVTGRPGSVTCRFTHVYPDGPAPYFTFQGLGKFETALEQWREIKEASNDIVVSLGGTITHHHAVGRDHRPGYTKEMSPIFADALRAAKAAVDPGGIMNPGVLIDPIGHSVGVTGAMAPADQLRPTR